MKTELSLQEEIALFCLAGWNGINEQSESIDHDVRNSNLSEFCAEHNINNSIYAKTRAKFEKDKKTWRFILKNINNPQKIFDKLRD